MAVCTYVKLYLIWWWFTHVVAKSLTGAHFFLDTLNNNLPCSPFCTRLTKCVVVGQRVSDILMNIIKPMHRGEWLRGAEEQAGSFPSALAEPYQERENMLSSALSQSTVWNFFLAYIQKYRSCRSCNVAVPPLQLGQYTSSPEVNAKLNAMIR